MKKNKGCLYIFLITFFILCLTLIVLKIAPFGNRTLIVSDLRDQYLSFINYIKTIFFDNNNLFYSFSGTLGLNMLSLSGYYLMSVFNIITIFINTSDMYIAVTFIILIKLSLCSSTFYYLLEKKHGNRKINYLFALCYGLMSYNLAFYFHIMWLDSIILMPLMILGIENIFRKQRSGLYLWSLALIIISNYYIGIITYLFSVIYFVYYYVINLGDWKDRKVIFKKYFISSLLSGLIASFILIPEIFSLSTSKVLIGDMDVVVPTTYNIMEILSKLINSPFTANQIWHGAPNLFAGTIVTILVILYFSNRNIPIRKRVINFIICLIMLLVFTIRPLNLLFHGLSEPNCFDYRQSFILTIFLILIASESYINLKKISSKKGMIIVSILAGFYIFVYMSEYAWFRDIRGLFLIFSLIVSVFILFWLNKSHYKYYFPILMSVIVLDLFINAINTIGTTVIYEKDSSWINDYRTYVLENEKVINTLRNRDNSFYRMEKDYHYSSSINDSMLFGYNGISHFDSTSNFKTEKFLGNLGFRRLISRNDYGLGSTKSVDTLLGIKYVMSHNDSFKDYEKVISSNGINVFKSNNYLGMGYAILNNRDILLTNNAFENINNIYKSITGINKDLYYSSDYEIKYNNVKKDGNLYYKVNNDSYIEVIIKVISDDNLYIFFPDNMIRSKFPFSSLYVNDVYRQRYFDKYNYGIIDLGKNEVGDILNLKFYINNPHKYLKFDNMFINYENEDVFQEMYVSLKSNVVNFTKKSSSYLKGNIDLEEDMDIMLSIPYDSGFTIRIDGEIVDYNSLFDSLISFRVLKGNHIIEIEYIPKGFIIGIIITGFSLLFSGWYLVNERKKISKL